MNKSRLVLALCCALMLAAAGCSRQQSDWQKTRETNTTDAYEQFLKKYPSGEFTAQAQARVKELYEERDWQKARDADTPEAYQAFLKQYPEGKWTEEARIRVENFTLAQAPAGSATPAPEGSGSDAAADNDATAASATAAAAAPATTDDNSPASTSASSGTAASAGSSSSQTSKRTAMAGSGQTGSASGSASGNSGIQLGAFKSGATAAHRRWVHLEKDYPSLLTGLTSTVVPTSTSSGKLYRLQALGLTEKHAHTICSRLKAMSQPCLVLPPTTG